MTRPAAALRVAAMLTLLLALAGCGFRPLYGHAAGDPMVNSELSSIYVRPLPDREGQLLHNALLVRLNRGDQPGPARFRLEVALQENAAPASLQRDQTASRAIVTYNANFTLYEGNASLTTGAFSRVFSYDYVSEQYSNISARSDIGRRAAEEIADEITNRLAAYFAAGAKARAAAGVTQQ